MILDTQAKALFAKTYSTLPDTIVFSHGRLELLGNHTDHNHGLCLVGGADLGITAAVRKRDDGVVRLISEGYRAFTFKVSQLEAVPSQIGSSIAITKGVMAKMKEYGYKIGGFDAALVCDIPSGSGISSSACFESLIAGIIDILFNDGKMNPMDMARIGQYAENVYFGKPSGLLDQVGTSFGGVAYLDFHDFSAIKVEAMDFTLPLDITVIVTPSDHAKLTPLYAAIPADMKEVAAKFGEEVLGDVDEEKVLSALSSLDVSDLAKTRAEHFYAENHRVEMAKEAVKNGDVDGFLEAVKGSQESSKSKLCNSMVPGQYKNSPQEGVDLANAVIMHGAARIMGGGFAGSIICFTDKQETASFRESMKKFYGEKAIHPIVCLSGGPKEIR